MEWSNSAVPSQRALTKPHRVAGPIEERSEQAYFYKTIVGLKIANSTNRALLMRPFFFFLTWIIISSPLHETTVFTLTIASSLIPFASSDS